MKWNQTLAVIFSVFVSVACLKNASYNQADLLIKEIKRTNNALYQIEKELKTCEYKLNDTHSTIKGIEIQTMQLKSDIMQIKFKIK